MIYAAVSGSVTSGVEYTIISAPGAGYSIKLYYLVIGTEGMVTEGTGGKLIGYLQNAASDDAPNHMDFYYFYNVAENTELTFLADITETDTAVIAAYDIVPI